MQKLVLPLKSESKRDSKKILTINTPNVIQNLAFLTRQKYQVLSNVRYKPFQCYRFPGARRCPVRGLEPL